MTDDIVKYMFDYYKIIAISTAEITLVIKFIKWFRKKEKERSKKRPIIINKLLSKKRCKEYYYEDSNTTTNDDIDDSEIDDDDIDTGITEIDDYDVLWNWHSRPYPIPNKRILTQPQFNTIEKTKGEELVELLKTFGVDCTIVHTVVSYAVTLYELKLAKGVRVNKVNTLINDIELNLPAKSVRIVPPSTEEATIAIEVANSKHGLLNFTETEEPNIANMAIPFVIGKNVYNRTVSVDIAKLPHLLIAGSTGSGKSVCINDLICSVLYSKTANEVKMLLIDPKMVELSVYNGIPHLLTPVITNVTDAVINLKILVNEMDRRYRLLKEEGCRNIQRYNVKNTKKLPHILVVIDEFADLMRYARKEVEPIIDRLAAMSRAVGIHLVMATQRPSSDVITGTIKNNFPARLALKVSSAMNSRIILDETGAEKLIGNGDALLSVAGKDLERIQSSYLSDEDVEITVKHFSKYL